MARGDNLGYEERAKGGRNSHSGGRRSGGSAGESRRGNQGNNLSREDRQRGGENSHGGGR